MKLRLNTKSQIAKTVFFIAANIFICSCGDQAGDNNADTIQAALKDSAYTKELMTDSGKLVVTHDPATGLDRAVHYDKDGKLKSKGYLVNGVASGAWVYYDAAGNIIRAAHYSGENKLHELDASDFRTSRTVVKEMGISFEIPVEWKQIESPNRANLVSFEKDVRDESVAFKPGVNIAKGKLETGQNLESLAADQLKMLHDAVGRVETVDEAFLTVDSCRAFRRYGMYYTDDNKVGFLDAIIIDGENIYVISCAAQNRESGEFLKYQAVFENLVLSIQVSE